MVKQPSEEVVYQVGCEPTFPPLSTRTLKQMRLRFDIELIKANNARRGFQVEVLSFGLMF